MVHKEDGIMTCNTVLVTVILEGWFAALLPETVGSLIWPSVRPSDKRVHIIVNGLETA